MLWLRKKGVNAASCIHRLHSSSLAFPTEVALASLSTVQGKLIAHRNRKRPLLPLGFGKAGIVTPLGCYSASPTTCSSCLPAYWRMYQFLEMIMDVKDVVILTQCPVHFPEPAKVERDIRNGRFPGYNSRTARCVARDMRCPNALCKSSSVRPP